MIWLINGLFCKILNFVPRHQEIVGNILGYNYAKTFTYLIGIAELCMAIWIVTNYKYKLNAIVQIAVIASMNILEFLLVPNLLLWGKFNIVFAMLLIVTIYINNFKLAKTNTL